VEPLGNVILEGWAQGLPVVACASAGPAELLADGENGRLVAMEDHAALAIALNSVIHDAGLRDHVVAGGTRTLNEHFTEDAVVAAYLDFFD
ncbi:glycosyltransferase, partial [Acinetobacter baumannii]